MTTLYERLMRKTFGTGRRVTLDEQRDRILARGCAVCRRTDVSLWQPKLAGPAYCPEHAPDDNTDS